MQVTHTQDKVTHAVIAQKAASSFGITNSAEFFHILSDTLYSDKPLAVVREVMCNAWDAHIDAGITDTPIDVRITEEAMIIRDFGRGIPKDMIEQIYCTYGESTKRNDGTQTGGFGLGSKSPFAVTDTFEVTSCHNGWKTIYRISKSLPELDGRPGVIEIVSVTTTESGVTVNIPMQPHTFSRFVGLAQVIARNGEIQANLNGTVIDGLVKLSDAPHSWMFTCDAQVAGNTGIAIRYGNVIYPVPNHEKYAGIFGEIKALREQLPSQGNNPLTMLLLAPPHSISVTPSRESLSMTDHTVNTIDTILQEFAASFNKILDTECRVQARIMVEQAMGTPYEKELYRDSSGIPGCISSYHRGWGARPNQKLDGPLTTAVEIVRHFIKFNYPTFAGFKKFDADTRLDTLVRHKKLPAHIANSFKKLVAKGHSREGITKAELHAFFIKELIWPIKKLLLKKDIKDINLVYLDEAAINRGSWGTNARTSKISDLVFRNTWEMFPWLRRSVIITHRISDIESRAKLHDQVQALGGVKNLLICVAPKNAEKKAAIFDVFKTLGYQIIDLTFRQSYEEIEEVEVTTEPKKKPLRGLLPLSQVVRRKDGAPQTGDYAWTVESRKIEKPEVIMRFSRTGSSDFSAEAVRMINLLFGDKIGVCVSSTQAAKYIKLGAEEFGPFFERTFLHKLQNNIAFGMRLGWDWKIVQDNLKAAELPTIEDIFFLILADDGLQRLLRFRDMLTEEDKVWLDLWRYYRHRFYYNSPLPPAASAAAKIEAILSAVPLIPQIKEISLRYKASRLLRYLDMNEIRRALNPGLYKVSYIEGLYARQLLLTVLKG